ncbi:MAG: hypothetical protein AB8B97_21745 [Granulosicoccus sp.]
MWNLPGGVHGVEVPDRPARNQVMNYNMCRVTMDTSENASRIAETDRLVVEAELSRLLNEKKFAGAPQMSSFLKYIVVQTLEGNGDRIKAYTVGVDALGKPHTFDAQSDPSVRVLALRLRKTLAALYEEGGERHAQIVLKVGSYVPEFLKADSVAAGNAIKTPATLTSATHESSAISETIAASTAACVQPQLDLNVGNASQLQVSAVTRIAGSSDHGAFNAANSRTVRHLMDDPRRIMLVSALFVFFCIWLMSSDNNSAYLQKLSAGVPLPMTSASASFENDGRSFLPVTSDIPTLYLIDDEAQSKRLRQVSVLMGSSVVQSGSLNVVRVSPEKVPALSSPGEYHMVLNEVVVEDRARIDAQILQLQSGVVVSSTTMLFDNQSSGFSTNELKQVEGLARQISDVAGSLYTNFCVTQDSALPSGCTVHKDGDPTVVASKSGAV